MEGSVNIIGFPPGLNGAPADGASIESKRVMATV